MHLCYRRRASRPNTGQLTYPLFSIRGRGGNSKNIDSGISNPNSFCHQKDVKKERCSLPKKKRCSNSPVVPNGFSAHYIQMRLPRRWTQWLRVKIQVQPTQSSGKGLYPHGLVPRSRSDPVLTMSRVALAPRLSFFAFAVSGCLVLLSIFRSMTKLQSKN